MKKLISSILTLLLLFSLCVNVMAVDVYTADESLMVSVEGKTAGNYGKNVTLVIKDGNTVKYINELQPVNGNFKFRFKYTDVSKLVSGEHKIYVNYNGENINDAIIKANVFSSYVDAKVDINYNLENKDAVKIDVNADIINVFNKSAVPYTVNIAFYGADGTLLEVKSVPSTVSQSGTSAVTVLTGYTVPEGFSYAKAFVWSDMTKMVPYTEAFEEDAINVLFIGSSTGRDSVDYLHDLAASAGVELNTLCLYAGNTKLSDMLSRFDDDAVPYSAYVNKGSSAGETGYNFKMTPKEALEYMDWDYVSIMQGAHHSYTWDRYDDGTTNYLAELMKRIRTLCPDAEIMMHHGQVNEDGKPNTYYITDGGNEEDAASEEFMFNLCYGNAKKAVKEAAKLTTDEGIPISPSGSMRLVPISLAFRNVRTQPDGKFATTTVYNEETGKYSSDKTPSLYADGTHSSAYGRYVGACLWFEMLTGKSCVGLDKMSLSTYQAEYIQKVVHQTVLELSSTN